MDYNIRQAQDEPVLQVEEPVAVYGAAVGQSAEPWVAAGGVDGDFDDGDDDDGDDGVDEVCKIFGVDGPVVGNWFDHLYKESPKFREVFERMMEESEADIAAGRTYSHEEFWAEFEQDIRNGTV